MKINDCMEIAEELGERDSEIALRSSINRYYYFLVLTLVSIANQRGKELSDNHEIHDDLSEVLESICPTMIDDLESLRELRGQSDYELNKISQTDKKEAKMKAESVFSSLEDKTVLPSEFFN